MPKFAVSSDKSINIFHLEKDALSAYEALGEESKALFLISDEQFGNGLSVLFKDMGVIKMESHRTSGGYNLDIVNGQWLYSKQYKIEYREGERVKIY